MRALPLALLACMAVLLVPAANAFPVEAGDPALAHVRVQELSGGYDARVTTAAAGPRLLVGLWCFPAGVGAGCLYYGSGPLFGGCGVYVLPTTLAGCGDLWVGFAGVGVAGGEACLTYRVNPTGSRGSACLP